MAWNNGFVGFAETLFALLGFVLVLAVATSLCAGPSTSRWPRVFGSLVLISAVVIQYYHLILASTYSPSSFSAFPTRPLFRFSCLSSDKGGKRAQGDTSEVALNPCFCQAPGATCFDKATGLEANVSAADCPTDGSATCVEASGKEVSLYLSFERDCNHGEPDVCSKDRPCTPCDFHTGVLGFGADRCKRCAGYNKGDCNFVEGKGPYCWAEKGSRKVVPCTVCCTEDVILAQNGTCV